MIEHHLATAFAAAALLAPAPSQAPAFRGGDFVVANDPTGIFHVQSNGTIRQIPIGVPMSRIAGVLGTRFGELIVCDWQGGNVVLVPPVGPASVIANVPGGLRIGEDIDGAFLVTSFRSNSIVRVTRGGQMSTVVALTGGSRPYDVVVDETGDYVFCDDLGRGSTPKGVFRADRTTGSITPIYTGPGLPLAHGLAFFQNGDLAVIDGVNDEIYRLDRASGVLSVFVSQAALGNNPESITEAGDGGFLVALESTTFGFAIVYVDAFGGVQPIAGGSPFSNLEEVAVVASLTGPTDLTTGPGSLYPMGLDVPSWPGRVHAIGLSASVFPGFGVGPGDPRGLTVNGDGLYLASVTGGAPTVFVGWLGRLDAAGRASPSLDLRGLPPGLLAGFRGFAQCFVLDPAAQSRVAAITNVLRFDFR
jgi:sugar lactone lactonase YvrE